LPLWECATLWGRTSPYKNPAVASGTKSAGIQSETPASVVEMLNSLSETRSQTARFRTRLRGAFGRRKSRQLVGSETELQQTEGACPTGAITQTSARREARGHRGWGVINSNLSAFAGKEGGVGGGCRCASMNAPPGQTHSKSHASAIRKSTQDGRRFEGSGFPRASFNCRQVRGSGLCQSRATISRA